MKPKKKWNGSIESLGNGTILRISLTISSLLFTVLLIGAAYARARDIGTNQLFFQIFSLRSLFEFAVNVIIVFTLFKYQFWVIKKNKNNHKKRILLLIGGSFVLTLIMSIIIPLLYWELFPKQLPLNVLLTIHFIRDLMILVVTFLVTIILFMIDKRQQAMLEIQKLSMENLQNKYEVLKSQIDPHFLFNSLNTLNGLIGYDDEKAHEYVDQLSSVFRHATQNKKVTYLEEELDFVESYIYLMKIRFNESLQVEFKIDGKYLRHYILPFGLQLLIENCIKHNVVSNKYPLLISIETTEKESIIVRNTIRLKPDVPSLGVGLNNLNERYKLIFGKEIKISQNENCFMVEIPLIKDIEKYNNKLNNLL